MKWLQKLISRKPRIIVILGPTATGKTSLSIDVAQKYAGEIISADSRQVYKGLDIGSAKITHNEMKGIPHHMIDVAHPRDKYSVQEFVSEGVKKIDDILRRNKTVIVCGGTGQYIDALVYNYSFPEVPANEDLRKKLEKKDITLLYKELQKKDPRRASSIDRKNKVRLIRALEVVEVLGKVPQQKKSTPYKLLFIGLDVEKDQHRKIIHKRIIERLEDQDMLQEARDLHAEGLSFDRMDSLGLEYRFMARHLAGNITYNEMVSQLTTATVQFAKRQRTWFKRNTKIHWFNPLTEKELIEIKIKKFLQK